MKKRLFYVFFAVTMIILVNISCKSQPPAPTPEEPKQPASTQPEPSNQNQPQIDPAARAKAEEARKKAADFEGNAYFPGEWEAAEALFAAGSFTQAANAYDSITKLSIPLYAQAREDEILAYRSSLISGGARESFPEYFPPADKEALLALSQYEAEDYYTAKDSAAKSLLMFQVMATAFDAWHIRQEIIERDFPYYDLDKFEQGDEVLKIAMEAYKSDDLPPAKKNADEALDSFNSVLSTGWVSYARKRGELAEGERITAHDNRTRISSRIIFEEAESYFSVAQELYAEKKYERAAKQFIDAEAMYLIARISASEKRSFANSTIKEAMESIERSDEHAEQAKLIIEGGLE